MPSVLYTGTSPRTVEQPEGALHLWPNHRYDVSADALAALQASGVPLLVYADDPPKASPESLAALSAAEARPMPPIEPEAPSIDLPAPPKKKKL